MRRYTMNIHKET